MADPVLPAEVCIAQRDPAFLFGSRYVLVEHLGEGGLGTVWKAWDRHLEKYVAIKRIRGDFEAAEVDAFIAEGRVVARLQHPNITQVYDVGVQGGIPFIVMQLVEGRTFAEGEAPDPITLACSLAEVARAVAFAHRQGVLHQDLKPENLMVSLAAGDEKRVLVLDFGIARLLGGSLRRSGRIGTPGFMSPEQESGGSVDPRSDVFGLGSTYRALLRTGPAPAEVSAFISRCVDPDPGRRFASMEEAAAALGRVAALPSRRKRNAVLTAGLLVALAAAGVAGITPQFRRWQRDREIAAAIDRASRLRAYGRLEEAYAALAPAGDEARDLRADVILALSGYETSWEIPAHQTGIVGVGFVTGGSRIVSASRDSRLRFWDAATGAPILDIPVHSGPVTALDVSPDGSIVATAGGDRRLKLWRADSGALIREWSTHEAAVNRIRFSPDGTLLASGAQNGSVMLWPTAGGQPRELAGPKGGIHSLAFSPVGSTFAAAGEEERIFVWDLRLSGPFRTFPGDATWTRCLAFGLDGKSLIAGFAGDTLRKIDLETGQLSPKWMRHMNFLSEVIVASGGAVVYSSSGDGTVRLWDGAAGKTLAILAPHPDEVLALAVADRRLVTGCLDGTLRCSERRWKFGSGAEISRPDTILDLSADGKGGLYVTRFADSELRLERPGGSGERILTLGSSGIGARIFQGTTPPSAVALFRLDSTRPKLGHVLQALIRRNEEWIVEDIDGDDAGAKAASAVGSDGTLHVVYQVRETHLRYARRGPDVTWEVKDLGPVPPRMPHMALLAGSKGPEIIVALDSPYRLVSVPVGPGAKVSIPDPGDPWYARIVAWRDDPGRLYGLMWGGSEMYFVSEALKGWSVRRFALSGEQVIRATGWTAADGSIEIRWITAARGRIRTASLPPR